MSGWMVAGWAERGLQIVNYFGSNYGAALTGSPGELRVSGPAQFAAYFRAPDPQPDRLLVDYLRSQRLVAVYKLPEHLLLPALTRNPVGKV